MPAKQNSISQQQDSLSILKGSIILLTTCTSTLVGELSKKTHEKQRLKERLAQFKQEPIEEDHSPLEEDFSLPTEQEINQLLDFKMPDQASEDEQQKADKVISELQKLEDMVIKHNQVVFNTTGVVCNEIVALEAELKSQQDSLRKEEKEGNNLTNRAIEEGDSERLRGLIAIRDPLEVTAIIKMIFSQSPFNLSLFTAIESYFSQEDVDYIFEQLEKEDELTQRTVDIYAWLLEESGGELEDVFEEKLLALIEKNDDNPLIQTLSDAYFNKAPKLNSYPKASPEFAFRILKMRPHFYSFEQCLDIFSRHNIDPFHSGALRPKSLNVFSKTEPCFDKIALAYYQTSVTKLLDYDLERANSQSFKAVGLNNILSFTKVLQGSSLGLSDNAAEVLKKKIKNSLLSALNTLKNRGIKLPASYDHHACKHFMESHRLNKSFLGIPAGFFFSAKSGSTYQKLCKKQNIEAELNKHLAIEEREEEQLKIVRSQCAW